MRRRSTLRLLPLLAAGCLTLPTDSERSEWGIGPAPACDPSASPLCWPDEDRLTLGRANAAVLAVLTDPGDTEALQVALMEAQGLSHRLDGEDLILLAQAEQLVGPEDSSATLSAASALAAGVLVEQDQALLDTYLTALENEPASTECSAGAACAWGSQSLVPASYPQAAQQVLREFESSSLIGRVVVSIVVASHVLETDFHAVNARLDARLTADEKVAQVVAESKNTAFMVGGMAGATSMIPVAGLVLGPAFEEWLLLRVQLRALFQIADLYGVSLANDHDALLAALMWLLSGEIIESVPAFLPKLGAYLVGMQNARLVSSGVRGLAKQLIGTMTLGTVTALGNALLVGQRSEARSWGSAFVIRDWIGGLARIGGVQGNVAERECIFALAASTAGADGEVSAAEAELFQTLMATARDGSSAPGPSELSAAAALVPQAAAGRSSLRGCHETLLRSSPGLRGIALGLAGMTADMDGINERESRALNGSQVALVSYLAVTDVFDSELASASVASALTSLRRRPGGTVQEKTGVLVPPEIREIYSAAGGI